MYSISPAFAEPYLAVRTGFACSQCHVNPSGGGKRTAFGTVWAETSLSAKTVGDVAKGDGLPVPDRTWDGNIMAPFLSIGGNVRGEANYIDQPESENSSAFALEEALLYLEFSIIPQRLSFYLDEQVGPGGAFSREFYGLFRFNQQRFYIKAGRFFLPYGLRLEDDQAFVRRVTGISYATNDDGIELGWDTPSLTAQLAITNGESGAGETDRGKQVSSRVSYIQSGWRVGGSYNFNKRDIGNRVMVGVFAGLRTGPVFWLLEWDRIGDKAGEGTLNQEIGLLEANVLLSKGHNLKLIAEALNPDTDEPDDFQQRYSLIWEYFPIPFTQISSGIRSLKDEKKSSSQTRDELFVQLHLYF